MSTAASPWAHQATSPSRPVIDARVVLLTHYIPMYQLPVYQQLAQQISDFQILLSTPIEPNRNFQARWDGLNVTLQKNWTIQRRWRHRAGFDDTLYVHVPYDTPSLLRRLRPDIVLSLELGFRSLASAVYRSIYRHSRLVLCTFMSEHTEQGRGWVRGRLRRRLLRRADAITYNGPSCRKVLHALGADDDTLFHFPYAANPASIFQGPWPTSPAPDADSHCRLLYVGQISERKGVDRMIEQLVDFANRNPDKSIAITLAGEGPLRQSLDHDYHCPNLSVRFVGNVPSDELPSLMPAHDAMIFPTLADEWGLVVNEALQSGLPVLASCLAQASTTLIEDGQNGWLYDPRQPESLEQCLHRWFDRPDPSAATIAQRCRTSAAHITPAWAAGGVIDACRFVLGDGRQQPDRATID